MKRNVNDYIFDTFKILFIIFVIVITLYPFVHILAVSLNDPMDSISGGIGIVPRVFSWVNYKDIFANPNMGIATFNSIMRTVITGVVQTFCTAMVAYVLARKKFMFRRPFALVYILTMYINAGIIPTYFLFRSLGLINSFHVYWVPGITSAWNMLVIRTYIRGLSESLIESAELEGANDFYIFLRIILPLSMPVLATMCLFAAVYQWNQWFDTFLFNSQKIELTTLQYELMKKIQSANAAFSNSAMSGTLADPGMSGSDPTPTSIRAAMTIIVSIPIILVYPFLQRYFVHGLTIGGVKE